MTRTAKLTQAQYLADRERRCPHCLSTNLHFEQDAASLISYVQILDCFDCDLTWCEEYALTGYSAALIQGEWSLMDPETGKPAGAVES